MKGRRHRDRSGLEGLPLKLVIVAVVMGISSPLIYGALNSWEKAKLEGQLQSEAESLGDMARLLYIGGPGNAQRIRLDLEGGVTAHVDYIVIGDTPGGDFECCVRYKVKGLTEQRYLVSEPNVRLASEDGGALKLLEGSPELLLECKLDGTVGYVEVRPA